MVVVIEEVAAGMDDEEEDGGSAAIGMHQHRIPLAQLFIETVLSPGHATEGALIFKSNIP